jgi:hypothetical protein
MIEAGDVTPRPWLLETHQESLVRAANIISSAEERYARAYGTPLIRVNLGEPRGPSSTIELGLSALAALRAIDLLLLQHEQIRDPVE